MEQSGKRTEDILVERLIQRGWHISFAESCTGGLASAKIVNVPNASKVFDAAVITYANEAKVSCLGVSKALIQEKGVVSEEVALEMARGAALRNNAQVGVGISGIAGPSGGSAYKPVGTVCFGFYINGQEYTSTQYFGEIGRNNVRKKSVDFVYDTLLEQIGEDDYDN